jgi:hypothetical protein
LLQQLTRLYRDWNHLSHAAENLTNHASNTRYSGDSGKRGWKTGAVPARMRNLHKNAEFYGRTQFERLHGGGLFGRLGAVSVAARGCFALKRRRAVGPSKCQQCKCIAFLCVRRPEGLCAKWTASGSAIGVRVRGQGGIAERWMFVLRHPQASSESHAHPDCRR